jgi:hypothetical protein
MEAMHQDFFRIYQLPTGRRIFALQQMLEIAQQLEDREFAAILTAHITEALVHEYETREYELRWNAHQQRLLNPDPVRPIDARLDRTLTAVRDTAEAQANGARIHDPIHVVVSDFLREIFPSGVGQVTSLPYVDQLAVTEVILTKLQTTLAPMVVELGLDRLVARLATIVPEYRAGLRMTQELSFATVNDRRRQGRDGLYEAIAMIFGRFYKVRDDEHIVCRTALLAPLIEQQRAIAAKRRNRRPIPDIDPDTGGDDDVDIDDDNIDVEAAEADTAGTGGDIDDPPVIDAGTTAGETDTRPADAAPAAAASA